MPPTESQHATPETAIAVMSRDIHYMKESLVRLEKLIGDTVKNNVSKEELALLVKTLEQTKKEEARDFVVYKDSVQKSLDDHETRLRVLESSVTKVITWGAAGVLILGIAEFIIGKFL